MLASVYLPVLLVTSTAVATSAQPDPEQVYLEFGGVSLFERAIIVPILSQASAETLSRDFLRSQLGRVKIAKFVVATDLVNAAAQVAGQGRLDVPYVAWKWNRDQELKRNKLGPVAETIMIGSSAVMRWRDSAGGIARLILANSDPLSLRIDGATVEIMHLRMGKSGPVRREEIPGEPYVINYYARTEAAINVGFARRVAEHIADYVGLRQLTLELRADGLFHSTWFPNVYRFGPILPVPVREEYLGRPAAFCSYIGGEYRCRTQIQNSNMTGPARLGRNRQ